MHQPIPPAVIARPTLRRRFLLPALALAWVALPPAARTVDPPPGGDYGDGNVALGYRALFKLDGGANNTAIGSLTLYSDTSGEDNTALGNGALTGNTTGGYNTACGYGVLQNNTTGVFNTGHGFAALGMNTTGLENTATGAFALWGNTTGGQNTANGWDALLGNTTGRLNTASGFEALNGNTIGYLNAANGADALHGNTTGYANTADGAQALYGNTAGTFNTANGYNALYGNTTGSNNTASGYQALLNSTTGGDNIALGHAAGRNLTTGSHNIDIGNPGKTAEAGTIRIGSKGDQTATFIAGISGATVAGGVTVVVDANGHLGTIVSSQKFKEQIQSMDGASESLLALRPVTFRYKHELDDQRIPQYGLIAEEVEKVNPDLVARDAEGKVFTVRYEAVNAVLLNEFLKEHRKMEAQEEITRNQQNEIDALKAGLKEQAAFIRELRAKLIAGSPVASSPPSQP